MVSVFCLFCSCFSFFILIARSLDLSPHSSIYTLSLSFISNIILTAKQFFSSFLLLPTYLCRIQTTKTQLHTTKQHAYCNTYTQPRPFLPFTPSTLALFIILSSDGLVILLSYCFLHRSFEKLHFYPLQHITTIIRRA